MHPKVIEVSSGVRGGGAARGGRPGVWALGPRLRRENRGIELKTVRPAVVVGGGHCRFTAQHEGGTWGLQGDMCASEIISQARRARCCVCEWRGGIVKVDRR